MNELVKIVLIVIVLVITYSTAALIEWRLNIDQTNQEIPNFDVQNEQTDDYLNNVFQKQLTTSTITQRIIKTIKNSRIILF